MNLPTNMVKGGVSLVFDCVEGVTNTVERTHASIARFAAPGSQTLYGTKRSHGLTSAAIYSTIRGVNGLLRTTSGQIFRHIPETKHGARTDATGTRLISALNGAVGDHLEATNNPIAVSMSLTNGKEQLELNRHSLASHFPSASANVIVFVHGLGLSDLCWQNDNGPTIGTLASEKHDYSAVYIHYNTGLHISTNGQALQELLSQLKAEWPVPIESISLIGHSMGGLVIRSACWYAQQNAAKFLSHLKRVICLGSPHLRAPLEKAGHALDVALQKIPFSEPFSLAKHRSAGIKDLRHGDLRDIDWKGGACSEKGSLMRKSVPLLQGVDYYFAAATVGSDNRDPIGVMLGDLLVRTDSATGDHHNAEQRISIKPDNCRVFHKKNHFDLLHDEDVHNQVLEWLKEDQPM